MAIEIWRTGIVRARIEDILNEAPLDSAKIVWLPTQKSFSFVADPFCIKTPDGITMFVEFYDYRVKRGRIDYYSLNSNLEVLSTGVALEREFHLSYPFLIEEDNRVYLLPEAHRSGRLTLYEMAKFPDQWRPVADLLNIPAVDATIARYQGGWWMFYALPGAQGRAQRELHVAFSDCLTGPWTQHPGNPVRKGFESSRPGGRPFIHHGSLVLPVQNCAESYGGAIGFLRIDALTRTSFSATLVGQLVSKGILPGYESGLHTLSWDGEFCVIDVRRWVNSPFPLEFWVLFRGKLRNRLRRLLKAF